MYLFSLQEISLFVVIEHYIKDKKILLIKYYIVRLKYILNVPVYSKTSTRLWIIPPTSFSALDIASLYNFRDMLQQAVLSNIIYIWMQGMHSLIMHQWGDWRINCPLFKSCASSDKNRPFLSHFSPICMQRWESIHLVNMVAVYIGYVTPTFIM